MDMGRDAGQDIVELTYRPEVEDFTSAMRARLRVTGSGRKLLWVAGCLGLAAVLDAVLLLGGQDVSVTPVVAMGAGAAVLPLSPWLQARQVHRLAERNGVFRARVTDTGVSVATDHTTASVAWAAQPRYRETSRVFVLFSDDRYATGFTMLPKRGLAAAGDADRLRAILDRHLTRV